MLRISLVILFSVLAISCSESDKGLRFSDSFNEQNESSGSGGGGADKIDPVECAFEGVVVDKTDAAYSQASEDIITSLFSAYVTPLAAQDSTELSGQVNYQAWLANESSKKDLCTVVQHFNNTDPASFNEKQKKVFYINAYNIFTIELILRNYANLDKGVNRDVNKYPYQKSIRNINDLDAQVWDSFLWKVGSQDLSLNQIEKGILIPMGDARVHFAVNCASKGCPPLRNEAFTESRLDEQLDEMSTFFVTSPAYNSIKLLDDVYDPVNGDNFYDVSQIFDWYVDDFENDKSGRYDSFQSFIVFHLNKTEAELGFPKEDLLFEKDIWFEDYIDYDWSLNEVVN